MARAQQIAAALPPRSLAPALVAWPPRYELMALVSLKTEDIQPVLPAPVETIMPLED
jgi:hypothetical protein